MHTFLCILGCTFLHKIEGGFDADSVKLPKSSVPAVVMVSKVDHTANPKIETGTAATSVISSSNPVQGEVEFYDKEL